MGKIRTKTIGDEEMEKKQTLDTEKRKEKKAEKKKLSESLKISLDKAVDAQLLEEVDTKEDTDKAHKETISTKEKKTKKIIAKKSMRGKNYQKASSQFVKKEKLSVGEAVSLIKKTVYSKFDESIELHLNVLETGMKGEVKLPHGTGKNVRVAILDDSVMAQIETGKLEFDILIATPSQMPSLAKYAKLLGPRGLMPNPKSGTVSEKPEEAAKKFNSGSTRFKTEPKFPIIHITVGKASFSENDLNENIVSLLNSVGMKNIKSAYLCATMGPSIAVKLD